MRVVPVSHIAANIQLGSREYGCDGENSTAERFSKDEDVGRDALVLAREHATRFTQPRGNLVEDQERAEVVASLADLLPETWRGNVGHGPHRLGDDGTD